MLRTLTLKDYGFVAEAEIQLSDRATMFTGETGSGKTMVLGAIAFALGSRASTDVVRRGARRALVTLTFEPDGPLGERLKRDGFEFDPGEEASIAREMTDAGKSILRLNGRIATASYVREVAADIAEIVGQHEAQRLLGASYHVDMLDRFSHASAERAAVETAYGRWAGCEAQLRALDGDERRARERFDDARYALDEIGALGLKSEEDRRLDERRRYLDNVERIAGALRTAYDALASEEGGASGGLGRAASSLATIGDIAGTLAAIGGEAAGLQSEAADLAARIARELDATEFDAAELDAINARIEAIDRVKRKYGGTIEAVLAHAEEARAVVSAFENRGARGAELRRAAELARGELQSASERLTAMRRAGATRLAVAVTSECAELALPAARFDVRFSPLDELGPNGAEGVEFVFSANAGEPLRPLSRVASGGELSRVLLALVVALAETLERRTLVFDEIDAGIGGATATAVGVRLGRLARKTQVLCVTHLAQLATWAQRHYVLEKREESDGSLIRIGELLEDEQRVAELARMLSGESHQVARTHARALLEATR